MVCGGAGGCPAASLLEGPRLESLPGVFLQGGSMQHSLIWKKLQNAFSSCTPTYLQKPSPTQTKFVLSLNCQLLICIPQECCHLKVKQNVGTRARNKSKADIRKQKQQNQLELVTTLY